MAVSPGPDRPNVVIFVGDDHGYGDLSCMGSPTVRTPRLDALAASGALLTNWYSNSPVCSPSRAALLSGRYPGNAGVRSILQGYRTTPGLSQDVPTLASALREVGYHTELVGKWHLGLTPESRPEAHGFDRTFGHLAGAVDYYSHIHYSPNNRRVSMNGETYFGTPLHDLWENGSEIYLDGEYLTDLVADRATRAVREAAAARSPFFLYVPFNAPHYPLHAPAKYKERFAHLPWDQMIMAAMISALDDAVGAVMDELDRQGVLDNTLVLYMSDNGPSREIRNWMDGSQTPYRASSSGGLKGHKFSLFEGGIRVPGIVSWPGVIPAGQVVEEPLAAMDVFPTVLAVAGGEPEKYECDGHDVLPVLTDGARSPHEHLFWEQGVQTATRRGRWKLVLDGQLEEGLPPAEPVFLADLADDPGETVNRAADHPDLVAELTAAATSWRDGIEQRWSAEWLPRIPDHDTHVFPPGVSK
ncbi:sulfatase-like hydrolase/transferase [Nonomuraea sp. NPDC049129]|uniref:sulfatase family protein n=1 Tax=Nonomuraea sp. NPDC049129 TaxID=3155272 RepID=UPI0033D65BC8